MAKHSRKSKLKKSDFQKVKLKVGKKLPKGNVVDTTFKTKKIVVKGQLKQNQNCSNVELSDREFQDCLRRINHHNDAVRQDTVKNLREMLLTDSNLILRNIRQLIEKLSQLFTDICSSVRKLTVATMSIVLSHVKDEQVIPFFPVIVTHLRCAATHLMHEVQKDALLIVDILMEHFPNHVRYFSKYLLEDIVNQISNQGLSRNSSCFTAAVKAIRPEKKRKHSGGTLNVNLSHKITSVSWHLLLCRRLEKILKNICKNLKKDGKPKQETFKCFKLGNNEDAFVPVNNFIISAKKAANCDSITNYFENTDQFISIVSRIVPLLCEIWVEAGTLNEIIDKNDQSDYQQMEMYTCILKVLLSIWSLVESWNLENISDLNTWFVKTFGNSVLQYCFKVFPMSDQEVFQQRKKSLKSKLPQEAKVSTCEINLLLCEVIFGYTAWIKTGEAKDLLDMCVNYVMNILNNYLEKSNSVKLENLLDVTKRYLDSKNINESFDIYESVMKFLTWLTPGSTDFALYLNYMRDILENASLMDCGKIDISSWLSVLPAAILQCNKVPWSLLSIVKQVGPRADTNFLTSLESVYLQLLEKLPFLKVDNGEVENGQRIIIGMLYWMPRINSQIFTSIAKLMLEKDINLHLSSFIIEVLNNRHRRISDSNAKKEQTLFISFLLTVSLGCLNQHLIDVNSQHISSSCVASHFKNYIPIIMESKQDMDHQLSLTLCAMKVLIGFKEKANLNMMTRVFFENLFASYRCLTFQCVYSMCKIFFLLWTNDDPPNSILTHFSYALVSFVECLATSGNLSELEPTVKDVLSIGGLLSHYVCDHMMRLSEGVQDDSTVNVLGEMTAILVKCCALTKSSILHRILDNLKDRISGDSEVHPRWYAEAKYELNLYQMRNKL